MKALSIHQPWAWLIVNGYKTIENRSWNTKYRGPVLIHASKNVRTRDYCNAVNLLHRDNIGIALPGIDDLEHGGIVGIATITDCVTKSDSPFFFGPKGFVLASAKPLPFLPLKGRLSFFETGYELNTAGQLLPVGAL